MKNKTINKIILKKKAIQWRQDWVGNSNQPIHLKSLLLNLGVLTLFRPIGETFSGMAIKIEQNGIHNRFMMVNSNKSVGHQHFTICHELYHLFVQDNFESHICNVGKFNKIDPEEYNADYFAAYFLLPDDAIYESLPDDEIGSKKVSLHSIVRLENLYQCSRAFLLIRLKELGLISETEKTDYSTGIKESARRYGYGPYLYEGSVADSVVGNYGLLANQLYDQQIISESHFYSLMEAIDWPIDTLETEDD